MSRTSETLRAGFVERLSRVSRRMRTTFDATMHEHDLTLARARALLGLSRLPSITQSGLACELALENATVVRLLDGMEKQGLIQRRAVEGDRRAKHVVLTEHGQAQAERVEAIAATVRHSLLAGASDTDIEAASRVLDIMARNMQVPSGGAREA